MLHLSLARSAGALAIAAAAVGVPAAATFANGPRVVLELAPVAQAPAPDKVGVAVNLILDDGTAENQIGDVGQFIWINRFTPSPADFPFQLEEVQVAFGNNMVPLGGAIEIVIHEDTDGDNDPGTGASFLASYTDTVQANDGATFSVYALAPPLVLTGPGDVLIGIINRYGFEGNNDFPANLDQTASQGRSWAATYLAGDVPANPTYPADEQWGTIDSFGFPGNWIVRASGVRIPEADLSINKVGVEMPAGTVVYTITVTNDGPTDATGVVVTDPLPTELSYISDDCGGVNGAPWTWTVGNLANAASAVCNITLAVVTPGPVNNTASVSADQTDPNAVNDASTATLVVTGVPGEPTLEIPTLGTWGLLAMLALLAVAGAVSIGRR